jgi:hemin uptake protein HemP
MSRDSTADKSLSGKKFPEKQSAMDGARIASRVLLGKHSELIIEHNGREYRLRLTQSGKLILTA